MSFCHLSKQSCTGFVGAFNIVFCTVNLQRGQHFPNVFQCLFFYEASLKEWHSKEYNLRNSVFNTCLSYLIQSPKCQLSWCFDLHSLLWTSLWLLSYFPQLPSPKLALAIMLPARCWSLSNTNSLYLKHLWLSVTYSCHRCWLSRSFFYSHLIPIWTKLNSKARTCLFPSPQFIWEYNLISLECLRNKCELIYHSSR